MSGKVSFAEGQLKAFVERIERLEEEKKAIAADIGEIYREAKGNGYDVTILRKVVALRRKEPAERQEEEALLDVYLAALGMTPLEEEIEFQSSVETKPNRNHETPSDVGGPTEGQERVPPSKSPSVSPIQAGSVLPDPGQPVAKAVDDEPAKQGEGAPVALPDLYDEAVKLAKSGSSITVALFKSALNIGYTDATSLIERLEENGVISVPQANGKRAVLDDVGEIPAFLDRRKKKPEYSATDLMSSG